MDELTQVWAIGIRNRKTRERMVLHYEKMAVFLFEESAEEWVDRQHPPEELDIFIIPMRVHDLSQYDVMETPQ